jgi:hypothetical protein
MSGMMLPKLSFLMPRPASECIARRLRGLALYFACNKTRITARSVAKKLSYRLLLFEGICMKTIDLRKFNIIKEGIEFCVPDGNTEPGLEELLPTMERNEGAVYWLQPKGGTVEQQEACIRVNGMFYALSSKVEKAIFRSVRLTRDFRNYERLVDGTRKLVIPRRLFQEKLRTSRRV